MIVLDTNVLSEPLKPVPDVNLMHWLARQAPQTLFITAITQAELLSGLEKMPAGRRRTALSDALTSQVFTLFEGRILAFDSGCAQSFSKLVATANRSGNSISFANAAIAAIARTNGFVLCTRDVADFAHTGVKLINPWLGKD